MGRNRIFREAKKAFQPKQSRIYAATLSYLRTFAIVTQKI